MRSPSSTASMPTSRKWLSPFNRMFLFPFLQALRTILVHICTYQFSFFTCLAFLLSSLFFSVFRSLPFLVSFLPYWQLGMFYFRRMGVQICSKHRGCLQRAYTSIVGEIYGCTPHFEISLQSAIVRLSLHSVLDTCRKSMCFVMCSRRDGRIVPRFSGAAAQPASAGASVRAWSGPPQAAAAAASLRW